MSGERIPDRWVNDSNGTQEMTMSSDNPILVTGSHRSGSTWVGRMLALSPDIAYLHEPFNIGCRDNLCTIGLDYWFAYLCDANASPYIDKLKDCLSFDIPLQRVFQITRNPKEVARVFRDYLRIKNYRLQSKRPLMKDPIALFSAPWLASRFDMSVIVLIRHPAAFAGSMKKVGWTHPFGHFLRQPLLMDEYLAEYRADIEEFSRNEKDIVDQAILLWNIIHSVILRYRSEYPEWVFVKHEELSEAPLTAFRSLYDHLDLEFTSNVQRGMERYTTTNSQRDGAHRIQRDSKANLWQWKERLSAQEVERIRSETEEIAGHFYRDESWEF